MVKPFQFNDENKYNSHGFRILNAGIKLDRFNLNPVMLDDHWASTRSVLGKWRDIRLEGVSLSGIPEFDMDDHDAARVAGKVERGYIKSCSMGILFDPANMQREDSGKYVLNSCELLEVSIVAIPSNANAIQLYQKTDKGPQLMSDDQVKLCLSAISTETEKKTDNKMKKIFLTTASLMALCIVDKYDANTGIDQDIVDNAIAKLKSDLDDAKSQLKTKETALQTLTNQAAASKKMKIEAKVDEAIQLGKIDANTTVNGEVVDTRAEFIEMGLSNEATLDTVLASLPAKKSLGSTANNSTKDNVETMEQFQKLSAAEQLAFKLNHPEAYAKIVLEA